MSATGLGSREKGWQAELNVQHCHVGELDLRDVATSRMLLTSWIFDVWTLCSRDEISGWRKNQWEARTFLEIYRNYPSNK